MRIYPSEVHRHLRWISRASNGLHRGDGYDVETFTDGDRYVTRVRRIGGAWRLYVAATLDDALAVGAAGWTPGYGPGRYRQVGYLRR